MLRIDGYWVFNAEQVMSEACFQHDGYEMPEVPEVSPIERNARVDAFIAATGAVVRHGGQSAYYDVKADHIQMPDEGLFTGTDTSCGTHASGMNATEAYYSTLLHEACHYADLRIMPGGFEYGLKHGAYCSSMPA